MATGTVLVVVLAFRDFCVPPAGVAPCVLAGLLRAVVGATRADVVEVGVIPLLVAVVRLCLRILGAVVVGPVGGEVELEAASSWEAKVEISLLCLDIKPSSRAISFWSSARVARAGGVVAGGGASVPRFPSLAWSALAALST